MTRTNTTTFSPKGTATWALVTLLLTAVPAVGQAETAEEKGFRIAQENEQANDGFGGEYAVTEMVLINAQGDRTTRRMIQRTLEVPGDGDRSIVTFEWPADVKGTRLLTWSHKAGDDDQWLYLPSLRRVKRISSRNQSGAFMGSEFAFEDLGSQEADKHTWRFIDDAVVDERPCWLLERVPKNPRSGYSKELVWVDKEYRRPLKVEYFDRKGELLKVSRLRQYQQLGRWWRPGEIEMSNVRTRKQSIVRWQERRLDDGYVAADYESESLADGD